MYFLDRLHMLLSRPLFLNEFPLRSNSLPLLILSVLFIVLTLVPFVLSRKNGKFDWFEIICIISAGYLLNFGLRGVYNVFNDDKLGFLNYDDTLVQAQFAAADWLSLSLVGYCLPFPRHVADLVPMPKWRWSLSPNRGKVVALYLVGLTARFALGVLDVGVSFEYYIIWLGQLTAYALGIAILYAFVDKNNRRKWWALVLVMLPFQFVFAFVGTPNKLSLLEPIFLIAISYHYFKSPISLRAIALTGMVAVLTIFPWVTRFRNLANEPDLPTRFVNSVLDLITGQVSYSEYVIGSVMNRSHLVDSVALVLKYATVPDFITGLAPYVLIPAYTFVPRILWSDKPIDSAILFGRQFLGLSGDTSIGVSNPGDFYMNLGYFGIVVGMFGLGVLYRLLYANLITKWNKSGVEWRLPFFFIYCFVVQQLYVSFEGSIYVSLSDLLKKLLLLSVVALFMRVPPSSAGARRADMNRAVADFYWSHIPGARRVLDLGCAAGDLGRFKPAECEVFGLELDSLLVKKANEAEMAQVWDLNSAEPLPFADSFFDAVVAKDILEHLHKPWRTLAEIKRVTRPGESFWRR